MGEKEQREKLKVFLWLKYLPHGKYKSYVKSLNYLVIAVWSSECVYLTMILFFILDHFSHCSQQISKYKNLVQLVTDNMSLMLKIIFQENTLGLQYCAVFTGVENVMRNKISIVFLTC